MELVSGFLLGLANNAYCIGVCAPVMFPFLLQEGTRPLKPVLQFLSGRFLAYLAFGFLSGYAGLYFEGRIDPRIFSALTFLLALWLIVYALTGLASGSPVCRKLGGNTVFKQFPFFAGIVMGLNVCPPFLTGLARTLQMGSVLRPVIFFGGFFFGSSLWVVLLLFTGRFSRQEEFRRIGRLASLLVGIWYIAQVFFTF